MAAMTVAVSPELTGLVLEAEALGDERVKMRLFMLPLEAQWLAESLRLTAAARTGRPRTREGVAQRVEVQVDPDDGKLYLGTHCDGATRLMVCGARWAPVLAAVVERVLETHKRKVLQVQGGNIA